MGYDTPRSVATPHGAVNIRSRVFKGTRMREPGTYWGVFIGQHMSGRWRKDKAEVEADAEGIRKNLRACLCCTAVFLSQGPHNRLCETCRRRPQGLI